MNNKDTRVKGLKIRGKVIDSSGNLIALHGGGSGISTGGIQQLVSTEPSDKRPNSNKI